MLKVNDSGSFVYLKKDFKADPKAFEEEQKKAKFKLAGKEHQLVFDGKVDEVVLSRLSKPAREKAITDLKKLAPMLDQVEAARPAMDKGETVELDFGDSGKWKGVRIESEFKGKRQEAFDYVFSPVEARRYQTATFTDNGYVKLETSAFGVRQEITGKAYRDENSGGKYKSDTIFYISEMVGVHEGKKKKDAAPAEAH